MAKVDIDSKYKMRSGYAIPVLGFGVYQTPAAEAKNIVAEAVKIGYRHVDSAAVYRNEGPSAAGLISSSLPRSSVFFTSKVTPGQMSCDAAKSCIAETLRLTGLEYIDLYLLHAPYGGKKGRLGAWRALVEARRDGKVKSIGVSNYGVRHLEELEKEGEEPGWLDVNQVELHPWLEREDIVGWCKQRGVLLEAYSPLVRGERMEEPIIQALVKKHNKTPAQVLLRWSLQNGFVPLPKTVTPARVKENADIYDFELSEEDMQSLKTGAYEPCTWDPTKVED